MSPHHVALIMSSGGPPRASGDEPASLVLPTASAASAPRERG